MRVAPCLLAFAGLAFVQDKAAIPSPDLVASLTKELKVTPQQATGGTGAIFGFAKSQLKPEDFAKLASNVPGMDGFLKAAPSVKGGSALGSLGSISQGGTGGLASLAGSFKSLGLSPAMAGKFVPVIQKYLESKGGSDAAALLAGLVK
jgi:hypothetical protein